jgi:histidinol-phosphate aminotransferase
MNEGVPGLPDSFVRRTLLRVDRDALSTYPEYRPLQKKIALQNRIRPENICLTNGSDAAIKYIFDAYVSRGEKVLLTDPTFAMYPVYCQMYNARPIILDYGPDLSFPYENFLKRITRGIRLAVIVNPNNPCGSVLAQEKILKIIKKAKKNNVLVVVDEAYFYTYSHSVIKYIKSYNNLVVLRSFSKLLGMAGVRLGFAASCPQLIENLRKVRPSFDVNSVAVLLAEEILERPKVIRNLIAQAREGKEYLAKRLSAAGIEYKAGQANFLLIKCGKKAKEIMKQLAEKKVLVGGAFKQHLLKDYIRITIGDKRQMKKFWESFLPVWRRGKGE